jgi:protein-serine/threonine kinase
MKESIMEMNDQNSNSDSLTNYEFLRFVGAGGFADVFLARRKKSSKLFAIKKISKEKIIQNNLKRYVYSERNIMIKLRHPFIVEAEGMFQDEAHLYISMEYCECGDLLKLLSLRGSLS